MYKQHTYYIHEEIKNIFDNNEQPMPRFVLTSRTRIRFVAKTWQKNSVNPTVRTLYISMCKGGGSPYKLVGTEEKSRILLGTFGGCFPKLSIFLRVQCSTSCKIFVKWSKPHCPPTYSATPCVKNQTKSLPSMGYFLCESEITIIEQELPTLS